jgi:hypothetical protein
MKFEDSTLRGEAAITHLDTQTMNLDPMQLRGVFTIDGLLKDLEKTGRLSGRGHITMDLTAQGVGRTAQRRSDDQGSEHRLAEPAHRRPGQFESGE